MSVMAATAPTEVIDQVAEETELEPATVERILQLTAEAIERAGEHREVRLGPGTGKTQAWVLIAALADAEWRGTLDAPTMAALRSFRNLVAHGRSLEQIAQALMPEHIEVPSPAAVLQARRNAEARTALLQEFGALRSQEIADFAASRAANRAALANRWRAEGRLVAVPVGDQLLYPGFQFNAEGKPKPVIARALEELRGITNTSDWQLALWFTSPTGWLGGRRPVDLLDEHPDSVVEAARREASDVAG